jgi:hypothetical protein
MEELNLATIEDKGSPDLFAVVAQPSSPNFVIEDLGAETGLEGEVKVQTSAETGLEEEVKVQTLEPLDDKLVAATSQATLLPASEELVSKNPVAAPQIRDMIARGVSPLEDAMARLALHMGTISSNARKEAQVNEQRFTHLEGLISSLQTQSSLTKPVTPSVPTPAPVFATAPVLASDSFKRSLCGKPTVFDGKHFDNFLLVLDNYINSHQLDESSKMTVLVSYLGTAVTSYRTWLASNPEGSYSELVYYLKTMYSATPASVMSKVNFRNMKRDNDQSYEQFLTSLQEAALIAYHGQLFSSINSSVIEQFLVGLQDSKVQETLMHDDFTDPIILLQRARKIRDGIRVVQGSKTASVNFTSSNTQIQPPNQRTFPLGGDRSLGPIRCWSCGEPGHRASNCTRLVCDHCKKPGHRFKDCFMRQRTGNDGLGMSRGSPNPAARRK